MRRGHGNVEVEAVFGHGRVGVPHLGPGEAGEQGILDLDARVRLAVGVVDAGPPRHNSENKVKSVKVLLIYYKNLIFRL